MSEPVLHDDFRDLLHELVTELDGIRLPVLGRRHLIANKLAAGRPKDLVDAELLEAKLLDDSRGDR